MANSFIEMSREEALRFMTGEKPRRLRWLVGKRASEIVGTKTVLDIGCGRAANVQYFYKPIQYTGLDPSAELIRLARERNPDFVFVCDSMPGFGRDLPDGCFDFGVLRGVLEHVPSLEDSLAIYKEALRICNKVIVSWHMPPYYDKTEIELVECELDGKINQNRYASGSFDIEGVSVEKEHIGKIELWTAHRT